MKKIISVLLAVALIAAMSVTVFAETIQTANGSATNMVKVAVNSNNTGKTDGVYYVDVTWTSLDFTYSFSNDETNTWNPQTHTYGSSNYTGGNWNATTAKITVTNHSNEDVQGNVSFGGSATATKYGVTATLDKTAFDLATGEGLTYDTAKKEEFTLSIAGVPTVDTAFDLGVITVALN